MIDETLKDLYFDWLAKLAIPDDREREDYELLLDALNNSIFRFTIPLDENRQIDGLQLRYRFSQEMNIPYHIVEQTLDTHECSMLEMMVGLALRGEEHIMEDADIGNQLGVWFNEMITSLKLNNMNNINFDPSWVEFRIDSLLNHTYEPNGSGGLFTIKNPRQDMRTVEIWYQMCWYLDAVLKNE